ncbi:MAG: lipoyl protein ligase domain-containing protein [Acidimicrobiales bacterium]
MVSRVMPPHPAWLLRTLTGRAGALHARGIDWSVRSTTVLQVDAPAVVLGSTQPASHVRADVDIEVVRRRSGGGAVLVEPGRLVWVAVVVPAGDPLWQLDVGRASWWLGEVGAEALAALGGATGTAVVHRGGLVTSPWSALVCFAGLGPGEVTVAGRKAVGLAQRRTRSGALFQCALPLAWDPAGTAALLDLDPDGRAAATAELRERVHFLDGVTPGAVVEALLAALEHKTR